MDNKYILAMYDVRGKQEFIYKSNKLKEIVGASYMIRECFEDYLYPAARIDSEKGLFNYKKELKDKEFTRERFEKHLENGYVGEIVYDGGGNFFVLYKDLSIYQKINKYFYRMLLEGTYSLRVLTSYIEGVDFDNYKEDQRRLYEVHRKREQKETSIYPVNILPMVQVDYRSFMPLSQKQRIANSEIKVSYESKKKYQKYEEITAGSIKDRQIEGQRIFDKIITEKGEESLLAVIYIDGNNMGAQVEKCLEENEEVVGNNKQSYESCVLALRKFSQYIQAHYIDKRISDINNLLDSKEKKDNRFVVYAGDEITFVCNARYAYEVASTYLNNLLEKEPSDLPRTSCAGIAIFHSHTPFSEAYRIAEECCESGKQLMKNLQIQNASLIDFHYCQGAIGTSLEDIREQEENLDLSRPWFMEYDEAAGKVIENTYVTKGIVEEMKKELEKVGRSNVKNLLFSAKKSEADFLMELKRIQAHYKPKQNRAEEKLDFSLGNKLTPSMQRKLIYDMVIVYDLWFSKKSVNSDRREQNNV